MVNKDCSEKVTCPNGITQCISASFTIVMDVYGTETTTDTIMLGCGSEIQCSLSDFEWCYTTQEVLSLTGLGVFRTKLRNCQKKCTEEGDGADGDKKSRRKHVILYGDFESLMLFTI